MSESGTNDNPLLGDLPAKAKAPEPSSWLKPAPIKPADIILHVLLVLLIELIKLLLHQWL